MLVTLLEEVVMEGRPRLQVVGDLDIVSAGEVDTSLAELQAREKDVVMALSYVPFMDCAGARVVAKARTRAARAGGQLAVVGLQHRPAKLLQQLGLGSVADKGPQS